MQHLELLGEITRGGQARIMLARNNHKKLVIIKYFYTFISFEREFYYLFKLCHPLIIKLLDKIDNKKHPAIICEYIPGPNFAILLNSAFEHSHMISALLLSYIAQQILVILSYLESYNIVYADLAAENIIVSPSALILCDFASAHEEFEKPELICGRYDFLAPEVLSMGESSRWSDLFSLGAILFEAFMQRRFKIVDAERDKIELRQALGTKYTELYYFISSCLSFSVWQRPPSATAALRRMSLSAVKIKEAQEELNYLRLKACADLAQRDFF
jgi:serine/threonine protein kinase